MEQKTKYKNKGECEPLATNDLTAILDLCISNAEANRGKQAVYPETPEGLNTFTDNSIGFFKYVNAINQDPDIEKKLIPDIESWCLYLGITRRTLSTYTRRGGAWEETIDGFKNSIAACKKQCAFAGKVPPLVSVFDMVNNHGYLNTNSFTATETEVIGERKTATLEEVRQRAILISEKEGGNNDN